LYFTGNTSSVDGLNVTASTSGSTYLYYIGGITYNDTVISGLTSTIYSFISSGNSNADNFDNLPIVKNVGKEGLYDEPEVFNDVFIVRQSLSVFENIYRISTVDDLVQLEKYAGGAKFNIISNT
jgi:hypothetical protein